MKRVRLYSLLIVITLLILFCLAAVNANFQGAGNNHSSASPLGERIREQVARVAELDKRETGAEEAVRQDAPKETVDGLELNVGDPKRALLSFMDMTDRLAAL